MKFDECYASAFLCNFLTGFSLSLRTHSSVDVTIFHCDIPGLELSLENSTCSRFVPGRVVIDYLLKQSVIPSLRYANITWYVKHESHITWEISSANHTHLEYNVLYFLRVEELRISNFN